MGEFLVDVDKVIKVCERSMHFIKRRRGQFYRKAIEESKKKTSFKVKLFFKRKKSEERTFIEAVHHVKENITWCGDYAFPDWIFYCEKVYERLNRILCASQLVKSENNANRYISLNTDEAFLIRKWIKILNNTENCI